MQNVSPTVGLQRLRIAAPFVAGAVIAQRHSWSSDVVLIGLGWTVVVQIATVPIARAVKLSRAAAVLVTALFWVGPASWLWCGTQILTHSAVVAYAFAVVGGYLGVVSWMRVTAAGRVLRQN